MVGKELHVMKPMKFKVSATGLRLFHAFRQYAQRWGPMIMKSPDRVLVTWSDRDRPVVLEADLEINFQLCKEAIMTCCETAFGIDGKEIPNLADFEAALLLLSLRSNFHTEYYGRRGGELSSEKLFFIQIDTACFQHQV